MEVRVFFEASPKEFYPPELAERAWRRGSQTTAQLGKDIASHRALGPASRALPNQFITFHQKLLLYYLNEIIMSTSWRLLAGASTFCEL